MPLSRRDALKLAPLGLAAAAARVRSQDASPAPAFPGQVVRMREPRNLEYPFSELKSWVTPAEQFYVRNHFPMPKIDPAAFTLTVEGAVERPLKLTLAELAKLGEVATPLTLECAGNGRVFLVPQGKGLQWGLGAVGNAEWGGVPLSTVLAGAGVNKNAVEVILVGADSGVVADPPSPGAIHFDRSLPIAKATKPEVLLATTMNGEPLTPPHGAPLRAVVGGYYGMASVKWLTKIIVTETPHHGFWQTLDYATFARPVGGLPSLMPVTVMQPKASIARPTLAEVVPVGKPYPVRGAAWAGDARVRKVEFSADGGTTWRPATLTGPDKPYCWRTWEIDWTPAARGPAQLLARATDAAGATQPTARDPDRRTYMINHLVPVEVVVR